MRLKHSRLRHHVLRSPSSEPARPRGQPWTRSTTGRGEQDGPGLRMGLAGIQERVAMFGGRMTAGPAPAGGWALHAEIPVPA